MIESQRAASLTPFGDRSSPPSVGRPFLPGGPGHTPGGGGSLPMTPDNLIQGARRSPASPFGAAATTNDLVAARFAPAIRINPLTLRGGVTGGDPGWLQLTIDRPSVVWPTGYKNDGTTLNVPAFEVLYTPLVKPMVDSQAMRSARRGIAYLSNPGEWWVKYDAPSAATAATLEVIVIDANDPAVASRYLSEPGCNGYSKGQVAVGAPAAANEIVPANPYRKGLTIQNVGASALRIGIGGVAADWNVGNVGLRLASSGVSSISFAGDNLVLDAVFAVGESAVGTVYFVEYF